MKYHITPHERRLVWLITALLVIALIGHFVHPLTPSAVAVFVANLGLPAHVGSNHFADSRSWWGIPNSLNVLSNLPFALFGVWGFIKLHSLRTPSEQFLRRENFVMTLFLLGLIFTTVGSAFYHLAPSDISLLWDRAGMAFAFAGMLGVAASERVSPRSGLWLSLVTLLMGTLALFVWSQTADVLPWLVLQFGSMALILILTLTKKIPKSLGVSLVWVVVFYALAKVCESFDHSIYAATGQWVSGHTLKHLVAALAALPIIRVLK